MKKTEWSRMSGKMLCGLSLLLVLAASGQEKDPFAGAGGQPASGDPFGGGGEGGDVDPFAANPAMGNVFRKGQAGDVLREGKEEVAIMVEMFEVDHLAANDLLLRFAKNANDVAEMRLELMAHVKEGKVSLQETLFGRSPLNERASFSAILEKTYPTEYDPPELIQAPAESKTSEKSAAVPENANYLSATPTAFDTRNLGTTLEFEAALSGENPGKLGLALDLSVVRFLGNDQFVAEGAESQARGIANIVMPRMSVMQQHFLAQVTPGKHILLGIYKAEEDLEDRRVVILLRAEVIAKE